MPIKILISLDKFQTIPCIARTDDVYCRLLCENDSMIYPTEQGCKFFTRIKTLYVHRHWRAVSYKKSSNGTGAVFFTIQLLLSNKSVVANRRVCENKIQNSWKASSTLVLHSLACMPLRSFHRNNKKSVCLPIENYEW